MRKNENQSSLEIPLVSVLFPVYNGAYYLEESIQSILDQTYDNFEIIIIDDGSSDDSTSVIQNFSDSRIRFYKNETNQGLAATLNRAINLSKGYYLARQDQDDFSLPQRFEKQVGFLESHPDYGIVGTWAKVRRGTKENERVIEPPTDSLTIKFELLFENQFVHSSVMIRKEVFERIGLYSTNISRQPPEDYELWSRIARKFELSNIPEILHVYNRLPNSMSRRNGNTGLYKNQKIIIISENLAWASRRVKPDQFIIDFATLHVRAFNKLSSRLHLREISRLLYKSADNLCDSNNTKSDILKDRVYNNLQSISRNYSDYLIYRYGEIFGRIIGLYYGVWKLNIGRLITFCYRVGRLKK